MDVNAHTTPEKLERYAFLWSLLRMGIATFSLFLGSYPVFMDMVGPSIMTLAWLVSGASALYLGYRWYTGGKKVFGGADKKDTVAFLVMVVTGINLGYAAIDMNIGMNLVYPFGGENLSDLIFKATGVAYALVAVYLFKRWKASGDRIFV